MQVETLLLPNMPADRLVLPNAADQKDLYGKITRTNSEPMKTAATIAMNLTRKGEGERMPVIIITFRNTIFYHYVVLETVRASLNSTRLPGDGACLPTIGHGSLDDWTTCLVPRHPKNGFSLPKGNRKPSQRKAFGRNSDK